MQQLFDNGGDTDSDIGNGTDFNNNIISFVSSNSHKYYEANKILTQLGISTNHIQSSLLEIQSASITEIAQSKAHDAFLKFNKPVLVEDDGLFIDALNDFPGPYSSYVLETIGLAGILTLLGTIENKNARFVAVVVYDDGIVCRAFEASICGVLSDKPTGNGWGYDPIFIPDFPSNSTATFAEMDVNQKIKISHRTSALKMFASWYVNMIHI